MKFFLVTIALTLTACSSIKNEQYPENEPAFAGIRNGVLVYEGAVSKTLNQAIFDAFRKADTKPGKLVISSPGGDIGVGMQLGEWIKQNNLDVEVADLCASSCANYIFTAAKNKYLRKDSVLIWHGSAWQEKWNTSELPESFISEYLVPMRERETLLFEKLKVDNLLTVYGQRNLTLWDQAARIFSHETSGWDYSVEDMRRFGLSNIILIDEEWNWRKYRPNKSSEVTRVAVSDEYTFTLRRFET